MKNTERIFYVVIIFLCLVGMYNTYKRDKQSLALALATTDTLHQTRNKLGEQTTRTELLYGTISDFKAMHFADSSAISKVQKLVDRLTISASVLSTVTRNNFTSATKVLPGDTVKKDSLVFVFPRYHTADSTRWKKFDLTASQDSFHIDYTVYNEFEITQKWKRQGLFKKSLPEATVKNLNPYTSTR